MDKIAEIKNSIPIFEDKVAHICNDFNITLHELLVELVRFLDLVNLSNKTLSPSYVIDLAWHELILFTRFYDLFCKKHYNKFIHHTPGKKENPQIFAETIQLYIKQYGKPNVKIWGNFALKEWELKTTNCGSCYN